VLSVGTLYEAQFPTPGGHDVTRHPPVPPVAGSAPCGLIGKRCGVRGRTRFAAMAGEAGERPVFPCEGDPVADRAVFSPSGVSGTGCR
jgi:hypothetical protein